MNALATINPTSARLPQTYESAKTALSECVALDECKNWADKAAALASYAKQANDDELMKMATRIRDRAIRRAGELLQQIEPNKGGRPAETSRGTPTSFQPTRKAAAEEAGLSRDQMNTALRVANVPQADFDRQVDGPNPPTVTALAKQGTTPAPKPVIDLKGRDPAEFNRSLHFIAEVEDYASAISKIDLDLILSGLIEPEAERVRTAISKIDSIHDRIITRI